jgi:hypothetical protein
MPNDAAVLGLNLASAGGQPRAPIRFCAPRHDVFIEKELPASLQGERSLALELDSAADRRELCRQVLAKCKEAAAICPCAFASGRIP